MSDSTNIDGNLQITAKMAKAIPIILMAKDITEGTRKARVSRDVFYRWMQNPAFKSEFTRQRRIMVDTAFQSIAASSEDIAAVLRGLLCAENESVRLRTALGMLEHISKIINYEELEERVTALEKGV